MVGDEKTTQWGGVGVEVSMGNLPPRLVTRRKVNTLAVVPEQHQRPETHGDELKTKDENGPPD